MRAEGREASSVAANLPEVRAGAGVGFAAYRSRGSQEQIAPWALCCLLSVTFLLASCAAGRHPPATRATCCCWAAFVAWTARGRKKLHFIREFERACGRISVSVCVCVCFCLCVSVCLDVRARESEPMLDCVLLRIELLRPHACVRLCVCDCVFVFVGVFQYV